MDIYSSTEYFTQKHGTKFSAQVLVVNFKKLLTSNSSVPPELQVRLKLQVNYSYRVMYNAITAIVELCVY